ncbi:MAG: XdhC family protein [Anaerolineae bacterium]
MKEVLTDIDNWLQAGNSSIILATVVQTWGSAPRKVGAKMAFTADGEISGSVSGGCVEGAVVAAGMEVLETGRPQLLHFGVADETAWEVGLACGGIIEVFVEPLDTAVYDFLRTLVQEEQAGAGVTIIRGPEAKLGRKLALSRAGQSIGSLGDDLDEQAIQTASAANQPQRAPLSDDIELFVDVLRPAPTLVMVGGVHIAVALTSLARTLGYHTIVVDPRRAFGSEARFPHADRLVQAWPEKAFVEIELTPETAVAMLTHDPKIDDPALKVVLDSPVFYIGALGSRKTQAKRRQRLHKMGFSEAQIDRIHGPIGLSIGAQSPEEIALAIMAEIVRVKHGA